MQQGGYLWNKAAITAESAPDDETLGEFGAVRNVNRRERKLEENFQEGLEGTTIVAPRLHYVYSESNLGEKTFLASQYYGKCQICGKQIFRSNGKPYFEACNILPTNAIPDRYKHSISEGWNSLCLCPNCAAEFKYGKKNLSELMTTPRKAVSSIQKSYCRPKPRQRGKTDRPCGQRWSLPRKPRTAALLAS